jgi:hypothetical protein
MPTTVPDIAEILTLLPADARAVRVFEILTIYWQGGTRTRHYSDGRWVDDFPALAGFGFDVIDARFTRKDWFVELPRTTEISDDVVKLKMWDADAVLISEFLNSGEGTKVRVAQYFPDHALVNEIWWGFLKQPKETEGLWFNIEAASGLRSPNLIVPRRAIYPGCQATFGGLVNPDTGTPYFDTQAKIDPPANDCPYNKHIGGSVGLLSGGVPFTSCPRRVPADCDARLQPPYNKSYMAFDVVLEDMGSGHKTLRSRANESVLRTPLRVIYGYRYIRDMTLLAYVTEPYTDNANNGFLRTLWAICEGPIVGAAASSNSWAADGTPPYSPGPFVARTRDFSGFVVNGQQIGNDHSDFSGIWGTPRQAKTGFSTNVLNYPNTCVMWIDYGRADFRNFNPDGFKGDAIIKGKKDVQQYTTGTIAAGALTTLTLTESLDLVVGQTITIAGAGPGGSDLVTTCSAVSTDGKTITLAAAASAAVTGVLVSTRSYTTNRAWCLLDLYVNRRYGLGIDISRFVIQDWIDLAAYCKQFVSSIDETGAAVGIQRTTFNADITEGKWSDHLHDICLAGMFTLPYYHQSKIRIEPLEVATPTSAPVFSDQGSDGTVRNIIFSNNQSTLTYSRESDSKIPNQIKINFDDTQYQNQSRPLVLNDEIQQMKAGVAAGDNTSRPVTKEYNAVGTMYMSEAYRMAKRILDLGEFEAGGIVNNFHIKFTTWSLLSDSLGLHPYSIIRVVSQTVNRFQEAPGYPYEYFRVLKLTRKADLTMEIEAQLFPRQYIANNTNYPPAPAAQNDGGAVIGSPFDTTATAISVEPGILHFTLQTVPRP